MHPDAVSVYDAGEADGSLYLVMELVDGRSLAHRLATEGPLPIDDALAVTDHVLAALGAAHAAGIVHRDVKPGNVLLGDDGAVKLADFGIAKRLGRAGRGSDQDRPVRRHAPKYLAPEQVVGEPATPATDLYATGVVLYEMLAGAPPFDAGTPLATAIAHRDDPVPDVRDVRARRAGRPSPTALARAMAKRPEDRFPTAAAMRAALTDPPAAPPPAARRPGGCRCRARPAAGRRGWCRRWSRRRRRSSSPAPSRWPAATTAGAGDATTVAASTADRAHHDFAAGGDAGADDRRRRRPRWRRPR